MGRFLSRYTSSKVCTAWHSVLIKYLSIVLDASMREYGVQMVAPGLLRLVTHPFSMVVLLL
jgi:hypothetical protein